MNDICFIMCGYNSSRRIPRSVGSIANQLGKHSKEFLFIDNASTDDTREVAREAWERFGAPFPLRYFHEKKQGLMYARLCGLRNTDANVVIFVDDDNILDPGYAARVHETFEDKPTVGIVGGRGTGVFEDVAPAWWDTFQAYFSCGSKYRESGMVGRGGHLYGAGLSLRGSLVKNLASSEVRYFLMGRSGTSLLSGDDTEICRIAQRLGYDLYYDDRLRFQHLMPASRMNLGYLYSLQQGNGQSMVILDMYLGRSSFFLLMEYALKCSLHTALSLFSSENPERRIKARISGLNLIGIMREKLMPSVSKTDVLRQLKVLDSIER